MLTSYLVKCPHVGCNWFGLAVPSGDPDGWCGCESISSTIEFQCPRCRGEWRGRIVGEDVVPVSAEEEDLESVSWPATDIGEGD